MESSQALFRVGGVIEGDSLAELAHGQFLAFHSPLLQKLDHLCPKTAALLVGWQAQDDRESIGHGPCPQQAPQVTYRPPEGVQLTTEPTTINVSAER